MRADPIKKLVLSVINSSAIPLETTEVVEKVLEHKKTTRTIILARLRDLRGDGAIFGKNVGSGKGVWIWWNKSLFLEGKLPKIRGDSNKKRVLEILYSNEGVLETQDIVDKVSFSRTIVLRRLMDLRGDQAIKGKLVGSGKGVWIWWKNANE